MKRLILMLAIAVMAATGAQAQFGNLGGKLKNKVKDKVKEKVESATEVTPIKVVQDHIQKCFDNFNDSEYNIVSRMCYGVMGLATYDRILIHRHSGRQSGQERSRPRQIRESDLRAQRLDRV